jgi:hypothetical protein
MKCKECNNCQEVILVKWSNKHNRFVQENVHKCFGVKEPFIINNINVECTEYSEYKNKIVKNVTINDAISHFKHGVSHDIFSEPVTSYAKMAVEALGKQVPRRPTKLTDTLLIDAGWIYKCPTCGLACGENKYHLEATQDELYCTQCGQKLDWN